MLLNQSEYCFNQALAIRCNYNLHFMYELQEKINLLVVTKKIEGKSLRLTIIKQIIGLLLLNVTYLANKELLKAILLNAPGNS